ncbi:hypothetical protein BJX62DRAFT_180175 [Aspergillus germanicus]
MSVRNQRPLPPATSFSASPASNPIVKRKKSSRACSACQQKRTRCSGGIPCQRCKESDTVCLVDPETDNRRRTLLMRKIDTLQDTIINIIETLRDEEKADWLIGTVRSNASLKQVQQILARDLSKNSPLDRSKTTTHQTEAKTLP